MSTSTSTAPATIVEKLEQMGHEALSAIDHAAMRLVGLCAVSSASLRDIATTHPFVKMAWDEGVAAARRFGVPVDEIEDALSAVLAAAQAFARPPVLVAPPAEAA